MDASESLSRGGFSKNQRARPDEGPRLFVRGARKGPAGKIRQYGYQKMKGPDKITRGTTGKALGLRALSRVRTV
jgi:hypothetical protein